MLCVQNSVRALPVGACELDSAPIVPHGQLGPMPRMSLNPPACQARVPDSIMTQAHATLDDDQLVDVA